MEKRAKDQWSPRIGALLFASSFGTHQAPCLVGTTIKRPKSEALSGYPLPSSDELYFKASFLNSDQVFTHTEAN
jgi:hypothetical protein